MSTDHVLGKIELSNGTASAGIDDTYLKMHDALQAGGIPASQMGTALGPALGAGGCTTWSGGHNYQAIVKKMTVRGTVTTNTYILFCTRCGDNKPLK